MYNYSIIIPHKNIPNLLERCLASIPQRDDVQVIVVDDNSNPSLVDFKKFPGLDRPHTKVIFAKEENGRRGAGYARNLGMEAAEGRWLMFGDADDTFTQALGDMMDKYADDKSDIVFFGYVQVDAETMEPLKKEKINTSLDRYFETGNKDLLRYMMWGPCGKFIKRSLVVKHGVQFSEVMYSNDMMFSIRTGYYAAKITVDQTPVFCYIRRPQSLTGRQNVNWDSLMIRFEEDVKAARFLNSIGKGEYMEGAVVWRWKNLMRIDSKKARPLLATVRGVSPSRYVRRTLFKLNVVDPIGIPFKRFIRKIRGR